MPSWKERFFVLKPSSIDYFMEGEDNGRKEQKVRENCSWCAWELISRYNQVLQAPPYHMIVKGLSNE